MMGAGKRLYCFIQSHLHLRVSTRGCITSLLSTLPKVPESQFLFQVNAIYLHLTIERPRATLATK